MIYAHFSSHFAVPIGRLYIRISINYSATAARRHRQMLNGSKSERAARWEENSAGNNVIVSARAL